MNLIWPAGWQLKSPEVNIQCVPVCFSDSDEGAYSWAWWDQVGSRRDCCPVKGQRETPADAGSRTITADRGVLLCLFNPEDMSTVLSLLFIFLFALLLTFSQELAVSEKQRRVAQQERDELADEIVNSTTGKSVSVLVLRSSDDEIKMSPFYLHIPCLIVHNT